MISRLICFFWRHEWRADWVKEVPLGDGGVLGVIISTCLRCGKPRKFSDIHDITGKP